MLLVLTVVAFLFLGREIALRWWPVESAGPYERTTYAAAIGIVLWLATLWILALLHLMSLPVLAGRTALAAMLAILLAVRRKRETHTTDWRAVALWLVVVPWVAFAVWRGWLIPPVNHDALAYHLPKAVLFARAGGFEPLSNLDARIARIPANYELLLAEAVVLQQRDTVTEWLSTIFYLLFAIAAAALAERWWKSRAAVTGVFVAGLPVALLHSGAHKNDLMAAFFIVVGLVAAGRFISTADLRALTITVVAFGAAVGTKPQAAIVALAIAPALIWRANLRQLGMAAAIAVLAFILLGGVVFIRNFLDSRVPLGMQTSGEAVVQYGDWVNLWQGPYVLLAGPFSRSSIELSVPWESRPWFWRRYELFFSHLGIPFALCAVATPVAMVLQRRKASAEAFIVTAAAAMAFMVMMPVNFEPHGLYTISLPRYALFVTPIVFAWTLGALPPRAVPVAAALAAISFVAYAIDMGRNDTFAPWAYVKWVREHRDTRVVPFDPWRAAEVVDRRAGPTDRIAFDASFGSWIHPAFGASLTRPVDFIEPGNGPPSIHPDTEWVVIDRGWNVVWHHPEFRDLSQARDFLTRGKVGAPDARVLRHVQNDPRFKVVYFNPKTYQAVFQRARGSS